MLDCGHGECINIKRETHRFSLTMTLVRMGRDLNVGLFGGDAPHIGAVALAVPRTDSNGESEATASLLSVAGHKEGHLAQKVALSLAVHCRCTVAVSCGIHLDNATKKRN